MTTITRIYPCAYNRTYAIVINPEPVTPEGGVGTFNIFLQTAGGYVPLNVRNAEDKISIRSAFIKARTKMQYNAPDYQVYTKALKVISTWVQDYKLVPDAGLDKL